MPGLEVSCWLGLMGPDYNGAAWVTSTQKPGGSSDRVSTRMSENPAPIRCIATLLTASELGFAVAQGIVVVRRYRCGYLHHIGAAAEPSLRRSVGVAQT